MLGHTVDNSEDTHRKVTENPSTHLKHSTKVYCKWPVVHTKWWYPQGFEDYFIRWWSLAIHQETWEVSTKTSEYWEASTSW